MRYQFIHCLYSAVLVTLLQVPSFVSIYSSPPQLEYVASDFSMTSEEDSAHQYDESDYEVSEMLYQKESQKKVSAIEAHLRRIGGIIFLKFLALRATLRSWFIMIKKWWYADETLTS